MIGSNFDTPVMHQDLASSTMAPLNMPFGGLYGAGLYNPMYLGNVQMARQLDHDKFQTMNKKENECKNTLKIAGLAIATILAVGSLGRIRKGIKASGGITKYLGNKWNNFVAWIKGTPKTKVSAWQKFKNFFKRKPKTTP